MAKQIPKREWLIIIDFSYGRRKWNIFKKKTKRSVLTTLSTYFLNLICFSLSYDFFPLSRRVNERISFYYYWYDSLKGLQNEDEVAVTFPMDRDQCGAVLICD